MAKIKLAASPRKPSRDIPSAQVADIGPADRALQGLGREVANLGGAILERERIAKADDEESRVLTELRKEKARITKESDQIFSDTDHDGYTTGNKSLLDSKANELMNNVTSSRAKRILDLKLRSLKSDAEIDWNMKEKTNRATFFKDSADSSRQENKSLGRFTLSYDEATEAMIDDRLRRTSTVGVNYTQKELDAIEKKDHQWVEEVFFAKLQSGGGHLLENRKFLNDPNPEHQELVKTLTPKQRQSLNAMNESAINRQKSKNERTSLSFAKDAVDFAKLQFSRTGQVTVESRQALESADKRLSLLEQNRNVKQARNFVKNQEMILDKTIEWQGKTFGELSTTDPTREVETGELLEATGDLSTANSLKDTQQEILKTMRENPGKLVLSTDRTVAPGTQEFFDVQVARGFPFPRYADKNTMNAEAKLLRESVDKSKALGEFLAKYPSGAKMLAQMQNEPGLKDLSNFVVASEVQSPGTRNLFLNADPKAVRANFGNKEFDALKEGVKTELEDIFKAFGRNDKFINSVSERLAVRAVTFHENGHGEDSVEMAANLLKQEYAVATSGRNNILLKAADLQRQPHLQRDTTALMERWSDSANAAEMMETLSINKEAHGFVGTDEEFQQQISSSLHFRLNDKRDGMNLVYIDDQGRNVLLKTSKLEGDFPGAQTVRVPTDLPFEQIRSYHSPLADSIVKQQAVEDSIFSVRSRVRAELQRAGVPTKNLPPIDPDRVAAGLPDVEL